MAKITDAKAKGILKRARCYDLEYNIETYPEDERDGKTDLDIVRDELDYLVELYEEDGTLLSEDLDLSREILRETKNGKTIPIYVYADGLKFVPKYSKWQIENARSTVNEYRRLKRLQGTF